MQTTIKNLEKQLCEEKGKISEGVKVKDKEVQSLQNKVSDMEDSLEKVQIRCKTAKETIEKQMSEKNDLKSQLKNTSSQLSTTELKLQEKEDVLTKLKADMDIAQKELESKKQTEVNPENNASLKALKSLFEEKDTECTRAKNELDLEKKRISELLVTIKVLRELNGMPTTPSPSPSPSPSLTTPPLPPPLQSALTGNRSHGTQPQSSQNQASNAAGWSSSGNTHLGSNQNLRKGASQTPPPLTSAPKVQRVIHVSETSTGTKSSSPSTTSIERTPGNSLCTTVTLKSVNSISKSNLHPNQSNGPKNPLHNASIQPNPPPRFAAVNSSDPIKLPLPYSSPTTTGTSSNEPNANGVASSNVSSSVSGPATSSTSSKRFLVNNNSLSL